MLQYHALKQKEFKYDAECVDRKMREYLDLRDMGINVDDCIRLTKFIRNDIITINNHKQLAQTIFTTPNTTLGCATSLFETYNPPSTSTLTSDTLQCFTLSVLRRKRTQITFISTFKAGQEAAVSVCGL